MDRWKLNLWLLWITQIISLASFGFGLPFIPIYIQQLDVMTPAKVALMTTILAAAPAVTMGIMAPIWGVVADRYGRKMMIMRAMFFAVFIIGGMGFVTSVNQLILLRVLQGLLTGTVTAAIAFVASNTPEKHLTHALGVITSSTFIGYSIGPVIGGYFAEKFGYRTSFIFGGLLMAVGFLVVLIMIKEDKSTLVKKIKGKHISMIKKYKNIFMPMTVTIMSMLFLLRISRTLFAPYISLFVQNNFESLDGVAMTTGVINALIGLCTAVSSIFITSIASKFNKTKLITYLLITAGLISLILSQNAWIYENMNRWLSQHFAIEISNRIWVFTAIYMLFFFAIGGVEPLITSTAAMAVKPEDRGALFGLQGMVSSLAWFVGPWIAGPIVYYINIEAVVYVIPIIVLINIVCSMLLHKIKSVV